MSFSTRYTEIGVTYKILFILLAASLFVGLAGAQTQKVVYNFCSLQGTCLDGANPVSSITPDGAGNFYGTTLDGGGKGGSYGNVFELSPNGNFGYNEITLHHFSLSDGGYPRSYLIFDSAGNLYGTASGGGLYGAGVVFELSGSGVNWTETVLYAFTNGADGGSPWSGLIKDQAGNYYGTTAGGGTSGHGGVFELSPSSGGWTEQLIYSFDSTSLYPSGLAMDAHGNIFGAAGFTVYELSPNGSGGWNPRVVYTFPGNYQAIDSTPAVDNQGNVFGTIMREYRKLPSVTTLYKLSPVGNTWNLQILASWGKGIGPEGGVVLDAKGNVYGATTGGGAHGDGTVFELIPRTKRYEQKLLWTFSGADGEIPLGGLILDGGSLYGTTWIGGTQNYGTVFEVTP